MHTAQPPSIASSSSSSVVLQPGFTASHPLSSRRWVREADELCVESLRRSDRLESINTYVATYKLHDPQWQPLLLPEVHVLQAALNSVDDSGEGKANSTGWRDPRDHKVVDHAGSPFSFPSSLASAEGGCAGPPPPPPHGQRKTFEKTNGWSEVYLHYNKLTSLELMSRHANFALRHIVQRGHAMYFITVSQHSILAPRGLVEASHITCAYGVKGERLRTYLQHVGPLDARDVLHLDAKTRSVKWEWDRAGVPRGVVAVSLVEGYGTWFQRKPMLWQRSRRIGALQAQMGAHQYLLSAPETVGRWRDHEVSLLEPHTRIFGAVADVPSREHEHSTSSDPIADEADTPLKHTTSTSPTTASHPYGTDPDGGGGHDGSGGGGDGAFTSRGGGGAMAVGIVASSQIAQNPKLYLGQLEAPVITALDAVHQLAYRSAVHHHLVRPFRPPPSSSAITASSSLTPPFSVDSTPTLSMEERIATTKAIKEKEEEEGGRLWRRRLCMEEFLPISWTTRTPPPYVPLEAELPFTVQLSRPSVLHLSSSHCQERPPAGKGRGNGRERTQRMEKNDRCGGRVGEGGAGWTIGMPMLQRHAVFRVRGEDTHTPLSPSSSPTLPVACMEFILHQGVDHYVFDDSPSARPMKWWNQKSNMPYNGTLYAMRSGWLDAVEPLWTMANPLPSKTSDSRHSAGSPAWDTAAATARPCATLLERRKVSGRVRSPHEMLAPGACYLVGHETEDLCGERTSRTTASHWRTPLGEEEGEPHDRDAGGADCPPAVEKCPTMAHGVPSSVTAGREAERVPPHASSLPVSLLVTPTTTAMARMARYHRAALHVARKRKLRRKKTGKK